MAALVRFEWRVQRHDLSPVIVLTAMPLILMFFLRPMYEQALGGGPDTADRSAAFAVTGFSVMFSMFLIGTVGLVFFRDHGWNTWRRLLCAPLSPMTIVLAKTAIPYLVVLIQLGAVLGAGCVICGVPVHGSVGALAVTLVAFAACVVSLGLAAVAACSTVMQLNMASNVAGILLSGLGGAIVPVRLMPTWLSAAAPAVPSYWALRALRALVVTRGGLVEVMPDVAVLLGFTVAFALFGALCLRPERAKEHWS